MAKKIQSNIWGMLTSFRSASSALYGYYMPKLRAHVHVRFTRADRGAKQSKLHRAAPNAARPDATRTQPTYTAATGPSDQP